MSALPRGFAAWILTLTTSVCDCVCVHVLIPAPNISTTMSCQSSIVRYVITHMLLREWAQGGSIKLLPFAAARMRRLLPGSLLVILAVLMLGGVFLSTRDYLRALVDVQYAAVGLINMKYGLAATESYFVPKESPSPLLHYWSLAVEEQFYMFFPVLFTCTHSSCCSKHLRLGFLSTAMMVSLAAFLYCAHAMPEGANLAFYLLPMRAWEILAGVLVAEHQETIAMDTQLQPISARTDCPRLHTLGILIITSAVTLLSPTLYAAPGVCTVIAVAGAVSVLSVVPQTPTLLDHEVLQFLGEHSYGMYLWHFPCIVACASLSGWDSDTGTAPQLSLAWGLVTLVFSLILSILTRHSVESGFRKSSANVHSPRADLAAGILSVVVLCTIAYHRHESVSLFPEDALFMARARSVRSESISSPRTIPFHIPTAPLPDCRLCNISHCPLNSSLSNPTNAISVMQAFPLEVSGEPRFDFRFTATLFQSWDAMLQAAAAVTQWPSTTPMDVPPWETYPLPGNRCQQRIFVRCATGVLGDVFVVVV
jgi:peptidoglycan/LPS O-acetylase OafA/YrhL